MKDGRTQVKRIESLIQRHQNCIRQLADLAQPMILRNTLLQRHTTEHFVLNSLVTTHATQTSQPAVQTNGKGPISTSSSMNNARTIAALE